MLFRSAKYGGPSPSCSKQVQAKICAAVKEKYGVEYATQSPDIQAKSVETCQERYGSRTPLGASSIREKIKATNRTRYGGNAPMCSPDVREKTNATCEAKYGVAHVTQLDSVIQKVKQSKAQRGTFGTSVVEDSLYDQLCLVFGESDIERQYTSEIYPFACDFYIRSRDLYIELNGSWTHGSHWFDADSEDDIKLSQLWQARGTAYYKNAVHVWTKADVKKRSAAAFGRLNYVVFWGEQGQDAALWFALGCPDGHDWEYEYSWLPARELSGSSVMKSLSGTASNLSRIAKAYQFSVFYQREMLLWAENRVFRGLPLQVWLYLNRFKFLGKLPGDLTDAEIVRGFTIAGVIKGYTVFDTRLMNAFVEKYSVDSIYDPCAGWGERLLYCFCHDITYHGVDINTALQPGYDRMISDFGMICQNVSFADSAVFQPNMHADAVFTCPPYGSLERYSSSGAENLDDAEFIVWWDKVVKNSMFTGAKYFAFQVNRKWHARMRDVVIENGFSFLEELMPDFTRVGHFNRKGGGNTKSEFESVLVFVR